MDQVILVLVFPRTWRGRSLFIRHPNVLSEPFLKFGWRQIFSRKRLLWDDIHPLILLPFSSSSMLLKLLGTMTSGGFKTTSHAISW